MSLRPRFSPRCTRPLHAAHRPPQCAYLFPRATLPRPQHRAFHNTHPLHDDSSNHYSTLSLPPTATPAEIKKQFFTLSKQYHPDSHPADPNANTRFVEISEAYHTLSVPEKREKYDRQIGVGKHHHHGGRYVPMGSYSSAGFAGSRAATGLNKKRGTFRGPPPSFYKAGGYGQHGRKRAEYAHHTPHGSSSAEAESESYGDFGGGMGPGQAGQGNEVPHFDDRRHKQMHDSVNEHIYARRMRHAPRVSEDDLDTGRGTLFNLMIMLGVIVIIGATVEIMENRRDERDGRRNNRTAV